MMCLKVGLMLSSHNAGAEFLGLLLFLAVGAWLTGDD
ncbi:MAG: hypothetical protein ACJA1C_000787 [Crocinitomicaceae bacterium]|jgi:hypothetical protein